MIALALGAWACASEGHRTDLDSGSATFVDDGAATQTGESIGSGSTETTTGGPLDGGHETTTSDGGQTTSDDGDPASTGQQPIAPVRVMTYNVKHAELSSLAAIAAVIETEAPDVVALQEIDQDTERSGNVLQADVLGELTGMHSAFFAAIPFQGGEYGVAILSRHPILSTETWELTSSGEQRIVAIAEVALPDGPTLTVADTHMGLDEAEREQQADEIVAALAGREHVVLMGDFNAESDEAAYAVLSDAFLDVYPRVGTGSGNTIPATLPDRRIDYIVTDRRNTEPLMAWVPETTDSDHRPVVAVLAP